MKSLPPTGTVDASARAGLPSGLGGLVDVIHSPTWSTAAGLLLHGKSEEEALASLRVSFGIFNTGDEVDGFLEALAPAVALLRQAALKVDFSTAAGAPAPLLWGEGWAARGPVVGQQAELALTPTLSRPGSPRT